MIQKDRAFVYNTRTLKKIHRSGIHPVQEHGT